MKNNFLIKLFNWEYWPTNVVYFPIKIYAIWLAIKAKSFTLFTITNPLIETGGLFGASKARQLAYLSNELKPKTILFTANDSKESILNRMESENISYPFIAKPDRAERGIGVALIHSEEEFYKYLSSIRCDFIVQPYIDYPFEAGVFYIKKPGEEKGQIPSIVVKEFLTVVGDGKKSLLQLMEEMDRARLVIDKVRLRIGDNINAIIPKDKVYLVEPIGNHNRGTKFVNGNEHISLELALIFDKIAGQIPEFYYGRFDLRAPSLEHLKRGEDIKIVEVNGVNAEPAHIYDPNFPLVEGITTLAKHWRWIFEIGDLNRKRGFKPSSLSELKKYWKLRKGFM
jgi:hypothetical protein